MELGFWRDGKKTAGPSTSLRFGRDDDDKWRGVVASRKPSESNSVDQSRTSSSTGKRNPPVLELALARLSEKNLERQLHVEGFARPNG